MEIDNETFGEVETEDRGYLGSQDTLLRRDDQGRWPDLPAEIRRHVLEGRPHQALYGEDGNQGGRSPQRSSLAVPRRQGAGSCCAS